jgi:hypothetical protein
MGKLEGVVLYRFEKYIRTNYYVMGYIIDGLGSEQFKGT